MDDKLTSIDPREVERFTTLADEWWDPKGAMAPLHRLAPVRMAFLRERLLRHFKRDPRSLRPFEGLRLIDIGCGGGLVAEPMARLGFAVTGIDAGEANLRVARTHAEAGGLAIDYRALSVEALAEGEERFDAALALEVVEHVADLAGFLAGAAAVVRPGGILIASTINRTVKSFLFAIIGAEYVLGWLPRGTHRWDRFLHPSELAAGLRRGGFVLKELRGLAWDPLGGGWRLSDDLSVNYFAVAIRPPTKGEPRPRSTLAPGAVHS